MFLKEETNMKKKKSLANETITALTTYIHQQNLQSGDKLPTETELSSILGVGRSTLREAVKILSFSNILEVKQGSGTFIKNTDFNADFTDTQLLTAKAMIEVEAIEIVITQETSMEDLIDLKEKLFERNKYLQEGKFSKYITSDLAFHLKIIELSGNPLLIKWYNEIYEDMKLLLSSQVLKMKSFKDTAQLHDKIYEAIIEKDAKKAKKVINQIKISN